MEIEIPKTLHELKLWPDTTDAARQLSEASGKKALVSIVYPKGSREVFHEDGVYEIATLMNSSNGSPYIAKILDCDGTATNVGFSLEGLAGVLVSCSNGDSLRLDEHPERFRRVKINGDFSVPVNEVLTSQVGKLVLMDSEDNLKSSIGRYFPTIVDEVRTDTYRAAVISPNGATTGLYDYKKVRGILVAERNLPPEFLRRHY